MKTITPLLLALSFAAFLPSHAFAQDAPVAAAQSAAPATLTFDKERSKIDWISDAPAERIVGTAEGVEGRVRWNLNDLASTSGEISFPVDAMKSGNRLRDRHLKGSDWLNADDHPLITFRITGLEEIERTEEDSQIRVQAVATGSIVVNGVEAECRADVSIAIIPESQRVRIQPEFQVRLADHNVSGRRGAIGSEVGESIDISGVLYGNWQ